ncbi:hypothetical protein [Propioniciclava soli]|uniref:Uncharacterized protein n=1 Tax=Propioniciclava soli TaxID=2775081 RepID=A0ABZ3C7I1_9ACTN|nr:hypothetical protein [Propioniciclava soli]
MTEANDEQLHRADEAIDEAKQAGDRIADAAVPEDLRQPDYFGHLEVGEESPAQAWAEREPDATDFEPEKPGDNA